MYKKIHAKYTFDDLDEFYVVNVAAKAANYKNLYVMIPKIQQIQIIATTMKNTKNNPDQNWILWNGAKGDIDYQPYRTTLKALLKHFSCETDILQISKNTVLEMIKDINQIKIIVGMKYNWYDEIRT